MSNSASTASAQPDHDNEAPLKLALRPREAARALGLSSRKLWSMTASGEVPHVRLGRAILYPIDSLREWLARQVEGKGGVR